MHVATKLKDDVESIGWVSWPKIFRPSIPMELFQESVAKNIFESVEYALMMRYWTSLTTQISRSTSWAQLKCHCCHVAGQNSCAPSCASLAQSFPFSFLVEQIVIELPQARFRPTPSRHFSSRVLLRTSESKRSVAHNNLNFIPFKDSKNK